MCAKCSPYGGSRPLRYGRLCELYCGKGSHMSMYDDQATYFKGLIQFLRDVDTGKL